MGTTSEVVAARQPGGGVPRGLALLVAGTLFMEILDGTILSTAAPPIARALGVRSAEVGVCVTAYLLTVAVLIPLSGWVADRLGARRTFVAAVAVFSVASLLCAASTSLAELTAMRVLQGAGGAMMVPVGRLVVLRAVDRQDMIRAIAYLTWPALVAPVVAPALGGLLTTYASWHWIFLVNPPLGLVAAVVALRVVPATEQHDRSRLDWPGFLGSALSLGSLVGLAALLGEPRVRWPWVGALTVVTAAAGAATVRHLSRTEEPLLALSVLQERTFRSAHTGGSVFRAVMNAVPFLLPLMLQDGFGWTPAQAGAVVLFVFVGNLGIKPLTTPMFRSLGFRVTLLLATVGGSLSVAACGLLTPSTPFVVMAIVVMTSGAFRSIGLGAYNTLAFADIDRTLMPRANTLSATLQQVAQGLGVAVGVMAISVGNVFVTGVSVYRLAFVLLAGLLALALLDTLALPRTAGDALRARP